MAMPGWLLAAIVVVDVAAESLGFDGVVPEAKFRADTTLLEPDLRGERLLVDRDLSMHQDGGESMVASRASAAEGRGMLLQNAWLFGEQPHPPQPTAKPTAAPTAEQTPAPTEPAPTAAPTAEQTPAPTEPAPTAAPTAEQTPAPTEPAPTAAPTAEQTPAPTEPAPTAAPTEKQAHVSTANATAVNLTGTIGNATAVNKGKAPALGGAASVGKLDTVAEVHSAFERLDLNKDGMLDHQEMARVGQSSNRSGDLDARPLTASEEIDKLLIQTATKMQESNGAGDLDARPLTASEEIDKLLIQTATKIQESNGGDPDALDGYEINVAVERSG